ncbi:MAG: hypothetical protein WCV62_01695 [Candidatus Peribacteraceae bacterium]|jgi:REP element-mobilizing transposase RayT
MEDDGASPLYEGRYRNDSARCAPWDYASSGAYFVTINTKDRIPWFGAVRNGFMGLSDVGSIVAEEWMKTPAIRPYVILDEWIVMPDHMHGIIVIRKRIHGEQNGTRKPHHQRNWQSGSLGVIIHQIKRSCTIRIHDAGYPAFAWQPRYHDHIIRDIDEWNRIRHYIRMNPRRWWMMGRGGRS